MLARSLEVEKTRFSAPSEVRQAPRFYNQTRTLKFDNLIYRILEATTRIHIFDSVKIRKCIFAIGMHHNKKRI